MALAVGALKAGHRTRRSSLSVIKPRNEKPLDKTQGIQDSDYRPAATQGPSSLTPGMVPLDMFDYEQLESVEFLASGAFSHVFSARYQGHSVVVKLLREQYKESHVTLKQMRFEQTLLSQLAHKNIVGFVGTGVYKGVPFTVLEKLDDTLNQRISGEERLSMMECLAYAKSVGEALVYLHEQAILGQIVLHRDLKPDNLAFNESGALKLIDFGLARAITRGTSIDEVYEMTGETGSLRYMAPEVALGMLYNAKADVYSLSLILWQMVQGTKPFQGMSRKDFFHHVVHRNFRPPVDPKWPIALSTLITRSWDPDHHKRPTAREFVTTLDHIIHALHRHRRNSTGNSSGLARVRSVFQMMRERAGDYVMPQGRRSSRVEEEPAGYTEDDDEDDDSEPSPLPEPVVQPSPTTPVQTLASTHQQYAQHTQVVQRTTRATTTTTTTTITTMTAAAAATVAVLPVQQQQTQEATHTRTPSMLAAFRKTSVGAVETARYARTGLLGAAADGPTGAGATHHHKRRNSV